MDIHFNDILKSYKKNLGPLLVIYKNQGNYDKSNIHYDGKNILYNKENPDESYEYIDYGVGIYKYSDFHKTPKSFDLSIIQKRFSNSKNLQYFISKKRFYEIGTPKSYKATKKLFKKNEIK